MAWQARFYLNGNGLIGFQDSLGEGMQPESLIPRLGTVQRQHSIYCITHSFNLISEGGRRNDHDLKAAAKLT